MRMWGQRNTVHIYAADDWLLLHTVFREREAGWVLSYAGFMKLVRDGVVCHGPDRGADDTEALAAKTPAPKYYLFTGSFKLDRSTTDPFFITR